MKTLIALALALPLVACGPKTVKLTVPQIQELEQCVMDAEEQVERQNCVERLAPRPQ